MEYPINGIMEASGCAMEYGSLIERPGFFVLPGMIRTCLSKETDRYLRIERDTI